MPSERIEGEIVEPCPECQDQGGCSCCGCSTCGVLGDD